MLNNMWGEERKPLTFRDFYKAKADDSDSDRSFEDDEGQMENLWQNNKKTASDVRKGMYQSQLKKVIEAG
jgi:hypothetical protein